MPLYKKVYAHYSHLETDRISFKCLGTIGVFFSLIVWIFSQAMDLTIFIDVTY